MNLGYWRYPPVSYRFVMYPDGRVWRNPALFNPPRSNRDCPGLMPLEKIVAYIRETKAVPQETNLNHIKNIGEYNVYPSNQLPPISRTHWWLKGPKGRDQ